MAFLRPDSDSVTGSWEDEGAATINLYESVDEATASDADYAQSSDGPSSDTWTVTLDNPLVGVNTGETVGIDYRIGLDVAGSLSLDVVLKEGMTTIASWSETVDNTTPATISRTLSTGEKASVTDWDNLTLEFTADAAAGLLLDDYPGAAGAWSLRQLKTGVTDVVRVRRDSDDTESDFTADEVTDGTLETWVGAGNDGYVRTLYDQTGNARDAEQTTDAQQPRIVESGSLVTVNGLPTMDFGYSATELIHLIYSSQLVTEQQARSVFIPYKQDGTMSRPCLAYFGGGGTGGRWAMMTEYAVRVSGGNTIWSQTQDTTDQHLATFIHPTGGTGAEDALAWKDGASLSETSSSIQVLTATSNFVIGKYFASPEDPFDGKIPEVVVYGTDEQTDRADIEQNIADYYGITIS